MSVRLFHRGARVVLVVRRLAPGQVCWWSPSLTPPDWGAILAPQLALLGLPPRPGPDNTSLSCRLGDIRWTIARPWSIIWVRLEGGSDTKRRLVAAALLRAARYARWTADRQEESGWRV
jgi:hypothetical protein